MWVRAIVCSSLRGSARLHPPVQWATAKARMLLVTLTIGAALAAPSLTDAQLVAAFQEFQEHAVYPVPVPDARDRGKLLDGRIIKQRLPPADDDAPVGAMVLVLSDLSKEELWIGSADDDGGQDTPDELTVHHLQPSGDEMYRWYGYIRLPAPISDRHFLIRTTVNTAMHRETDGRMWSRHWQIEPGGQDTAQAIVAGGDVDGVTPEMFEKAVWTPYNQGNWIFIGLPDGRTIVGYQAAGSMGGGFPDGLMNRYIYWGLGKLMKDVVEKAGKARRHYVTGHPPLTGGSGLPLPPFDAPSMSAE